MGQVIGENPKTDDLVVNVLKGKQLTNMRSKSADDAITLTLDGHVAEATTANLALIIGDALRTPPLATGVLAGTTRDWLLAADGAAALGLDAGEAAFGVEELLAADEAILCSSVAGILPLVEVGGCPIGGGRPGPWARRLRDAREAWIAARSGG
jgi:branched-chain amino acid aminotransferase